MFHTSSPQHRDPYLIVSYLQKWERVMTLSPLSKFEYWQLRSSLSQTQLYYVSERQRLSAIPLTHKVTWSHIGNKFMLVSCEYYNTLRRLQTHRELYHLDWVPRISTTWSVGQELCRTPKLSTTDIIWNLSSTSTSMNMCGWIFSIKLGRISWSSLHICDILIVTMRLTVKACLYAHNNDRHTTNPPALTQGSRPITAREKPHLITTRAHLTETYASSFIT